MSHPGGQEPQGQPQPGFPAWRPQQPLNGQPQGYGQPGQQVQPQFQGAPAQPGYPQQQGSPGYPQQVGQPGSWGRPGYQQPGYPAQQPLPQQGQPQQWGTPQGFSHQEGFPGAQQGGQGAGPLTKAGPGAIPAVLGVVLQLGALFGLPWITFTSGSQSVTMTFLDLLKAVNDNSAASGFGATYVQFLGFLVTAATALSVLPWTLGALRAKRSAFLLSGIRSRDLTRANFWWYRTVFSGRATVMLIIHAVGIATVYWGNFASLGLGPILLFVGAVLVVVGAAVGPRQTPAMP
ncbi:hypothetical protein ACWEOE_23940 [Amycolatopsis sp. NPDC004368]